MICSADVADDILPLGVVGGSAPYILPLGVVGGSAPYIRGVGGNGVATACLILLVLIITFLIFYPLVAGPPGPAQYRTSDSAGSTEYGAAEGMAPDAGRLMEVGFEPALSEDEGRVEKFYAGGARKGGSPHFIKHQPISSAAGGRMWSTSPTTGRIVHPDPPEIPERIGDEDGDGQGQWALKGYRGAIVGFPDEAGPWTGSSSGWGTADRRIGRPVRGNPFDLDRYESPQAAPPCFDDDAAPAFGFGEAHAYQARARNDPTRVWTGIHRRRALIDRMVREELEIEEARPWWGRHEV